MVLQQSNSATLAPAQPDMTRQEFVRVTLSAHRTMRFRPIADYSFASKVVVTDIVAAELAQAAINYPLAFTQRGETTDLVALLSLTPGRNLYISVQGTWLVDFVPGSICTYPFQYHSAGGSGNAALYADMSSGLLTADVGDPLFTEAGKPSEKAKEIVKILRAFEKSRRMTQKICAQLRHYNLLVPWGADCEVESLRQLLRVDEAALNRLPPEIFRGLHQTGAFPIIYAHLLSMALLPRLANLARLHAEADAKRQQLLQSCFRLDDSITDSFSF